MTELLLLCALLYRWLLNHLTHMQARVAFVSTHDKAPISHSAHYRVPSPGVTQSGGVQSTAAAGGLCGMSDWSLPAASPIDRRGDGISAVISVAPSPLDPRPAPLAGEGTAGW